MIVRHAFLVVCCLSLAACATFLRVAENKTDDASPHGLVVNQRASYDVNVVAHLPDVTPRAPGRPLQAVDQDRVLSVGVWRMPFASGELGLKLTGSQVLQEVTLSSQPGSTRAVDAAKAALGADTEIRNALNPTATPIPATPTP